MEACAARRALPHLRPPPLEGEDDLGRAAALAQVAAQLAGLAGEDVADGLLKRRVELRVVGAQLDQAELVEGEGQVQPVGQGLGAPGELPAGALTAGEDEGEGGGGAAAQLAGAAQSGHAADQVGVHGLHVEEAVARQGVDHGAAKVGHGFSGNKMGKERLHATRYEHCSLSEVPLLHDLGRYDASAVGMAAGAEEGSEVGAVAEGAEVPRVHREPASAAQPPLVGQRRRGLPLLVYLEDELWPGRGPLVVAAQAGLAELAREEVRRLLLFAAATVRGETLQLAIEVRVAAVARGGDRSVLKIVNQSYSLITTHLKFEQKNDTNLCR